LKSPEFIIEPQGASVTIWRSPRPQSFKLRPYVDSGYDVIGSADDAFRLFGLRIHDLSDARWTWHQLAEILQVAFGLNEALTALENHPQLGSIITQRKHAAHS
jgi:hypothetical protein